MTPIVASAANVKIKKGSILVYRVFDVAEEISVSKVEEILQDHRGPDRFKVPKYIDRALILKNPPVSFGLGEEKITIESEQGEKFEYKADVMVKIRDFGVLSLIYQIPIPQGADWNDLLKMAALFEEGSEIDQIAQQQTKEVLTAITSALKKPTNYNTFEDYIIYFIEEFESPTSLKELIAKAPITELLMAEDKVVLGDALKKNTLENIYQYGENDLAVVEWNSALVIEPNGGREVPDILEFALTHLMEMRYYDDLLDTKLGLLYDDIEKRRSTVWKNRFEKIYQESSSRYIEFSEFIERVENSLKVVGDFYLAIIYRAATRRFRVSDWQQNIARKMSILAQVSSLLQGEVNTRRSLIMEIVIILLIAFEIISALAKTL